MPIVVVVQVFCEESSQVADIFRSKRTRSSLKAVTGGDRGARLDSTVQEDQNHVSTNSNSQLCAEDTCAVSQSKWAQETIEKGKKVRSVLRTLWS